MKFSTRLNSFALGKGKKLPSGEESVLDLIRIAGNVDGLTSLELNYPEHFGGHTVEEIAEALESHGLTLEGIQLRWPSPEFSRGGFTNVDPAVRQRAVDLVKKAIDVCRELGASHVLLWPAHDGYEYPLQMEYYAAWGYLVESLQEIADYAGDVRVSVEYKPAEPRGRTLLDTTGAVMHLLSLVNRPNIGVTLDFGHLLMAHENPAQSAAMCLRSNKLFGLQLNDSHGAADDGLLVGSIHLPQTLELMYYIRKYGYTGTMYFDTDPVRENPVVECEMNIQRIKNLVRIADDLLAKESHEPSDDALSVSGMVWENLVRTR
jgi:xylose isomerase